MWAVIPAKQTRCSRSWIVCISQRPSSGASIPFASQTRKEIKALRRALRSVHYDAVLDLQGALRSAVIGRMAASRRFIGESNPRERAARWLFTERVDTHTAHVIEQDIELASAVAGDVLSPVQPFLPTDPAAEAWAEERLPSKTGSPAVLINPGAGWGAKRWPVERYAEVARGLAQPRLSRSGQCRSGRAISCRHHRARRPEAVQFHCSVQSSNSLPSPAV